MCSFAPTDQIVIWEVSKPSDGLWISHGKSNEKKKSENLQSFFCCRNLPLPWQHNFHNNCLSALRFQSSQIPEIPGFILFQNGTNFSDLVLYFLSRFWLFRRAVRKNYQYIMKNLEFHLCRSTKFQKMCLDISVVLPEEWLEKRLCK